MTPSSPDHTGPAQGASRVGSTGPTGPGPQLRPTLGDLKSKAQGLGPVLDSRISPNSDLIKLGGMGFMYSIARRKEGRY